MTDTVREESPTSIDPAALLGGTMDPARLEQFKNAVFQNVNTVESLRDWLSSPTRAKNTTSQPSFSPSRSA